MIKNIKFPANLCLKQILEEKLCRKKIVTQIKIKYLYHWHMSYSEIICQIAVKKINKKNFEVRGRDRAQKFRKDSQNMGKMANNRFSKGVFFKWPVYVHWTWPIHFLCPNDN